MISLRTIAETDLQAVIALLTRGFSVPRAHWVHALDQLTGHPTPPGLPKYGYLLEDGSSVVGVLLLISTCTEVDGTPRCRSNVSSWYVEPAYRSYGSLLAMRPLRHRTTTLFNTSPAPHTWPILEKQGFESFCTGRVIAIPAFNRAPGKVRVQRWHESSPLPNGEGQLLRDHAAYGCLSVTCTMGTTITPFVFGLHRRYGVLPVAHLVYCRSIEDFLAYAGPLGRFLLRQRIGFVIMDATGPVAGLVGRYFGGRPRYRRGGDHVRLGDVAYSEQPMFGYS